VYLGERDVTFKLQPAAFPRIEGEQLTARLIEGDFPNYQQLIPSGYPNRVTVQRDALKEAVNRVRLVGGQSRDSSPIRLAMSENGLELSATAQDVGQSFEPVEAKYEGTEVTVAFNSQFLLDGIEAAGSDEVTIETIDPLKPAVLRGTDASDFLYLLMPVRIT
jgi:DNA polymerase-3 subunit beta